MRVLHVTRDLPPRVRGGISVAVGGLVTAAAPHVDQAVVSFDGWRPRAATGGPPPTEDSLAGVPVLRISAPAHLDAAAAFARTFAPELVLVHHGMLFDAACTFAAAPRALFVHVLQAALSAERGLTKETLSAAAQRRALAAADAVFVPSFAAALPDAQVLPLGVAHRERPAVPRDADLVVCVGRFDVAKGTADLLAAVPAVLAARPATRFVLAGGLPDSPKSARRWIRRWTESATDAERAAVSFPGWLEPSAVAELQARAAVVVAPSHLETFGLAVLEAQQMGAAVVASDIAAHRELIADGVTGRLVPRDGLANGILELLGDVALQRRLGSAAIEAAREATWERRIGAHVRAWRALV